MNNDLISREALKEKLSGENYQTYTHEYGYAIPTEWVMNAIDNAPTVKTYCYFCGQTEHGQIEERTQGEWAFDEKENFYCDQCGKYPHDQYATTDFCPNCGADMRGGAE